MNSAYLSPHSSLQDSAFPILTAASFVDGGPARIPIRALAANLRPTILHRAAVAVAVPQRCLSKVFEISGSITTESQQ